MNICDNLVELIKFKKKKPILRTDYVEWQVPSWDLCNTILLEFLLNNFNLSSEDLIFAIDNAYDIDVRSDYDDGVEYYPYISYSWLAHFLKEKGYEVN